MSTPPASRSRARGESAPLTDLLSRLPGVMLRDQGRLRRRIEGVRGGLDAPARQAAVEEIAAEIDAAVARLERRRAGVPEIRYPEALPVSQRKDDILATIRDHQVVIVAGETGSGKTTQLPKICLELGRGVYGLIGHTQPRRLAARTVADRIAEELGTPLGTAVGYKIRFTDRAGDDTLVKLMTDGILLAEIQTDRLLRQYDTLIIDEAHERSLNIDFILGYVKQLLPKRPDLKVIITSATIDPERFARHFGDAHKNAPIVEVSGRTYPVEVRYRPLVDDTAEDTAEDTDAGEDAEPRDQTRAILDAVDELAAEGPGDILVFLSGEREIRDTADALRRHVQGSRALRDTEVLPLFARLSTAEQHRVFAPHPGRRVVLATNVAETSLTVPGIRYVMDPGMARISRYSHRLKVQRLPIEAVSQASANQRKGRCGRLADGICIRLYSQGDFESRPEFTDPEILRTNLASVILQMTALGLGDMSAFPFVEPPDRRNVADGVQLLQELGAIDPAATDPRKRLTATGRKLAQLPVDPRLARMVLEAERLRLRPRGHGDRGGTVHPGPAGAAARPAAGGRREARPVRRSRVGLRRLPQPVETPPGQAEGAVLQRLPPDVQGRIPQLPAGTRVAGHLQPTPPGDPVARASTPTTRRPPQTRAAPSQRRSTRLCCPGCCRTSGCGTPSGRTISVPGGPGSRSFPDRRCSGSGRSG